MKTQKYRIYILVIILIHFVFGVSIATTNLLVDYMSEGADIIGVESNELEDNSDFYVGKTVYTVLRVSSSSSDTLYANAINSDAWKYKFLAEFTSEEELSSLEEDEIVAIAGKVIKAEWYHLAPVAMIECQIIAKDLEALAIQSELISAVEIAIADRENAIAIQSAAEKKEYIDSCTTIKYKDIERNPEKFKNQRIKITGKVIQVSEGWFDSVTLRVRDNNRDIWYVTYTRAKEEDRILENDRITIYGECQGVETYTTILRTSVTIPAIKAEYIDY